MAFARLNFVWAWTKPKIVVGWQACECEGGDLAFVVHHLKQRRSAASGTKI